MEILTLSLNRTSNNNAFIVNTFIIVYALQFCNAVIVSALSLYKMSPAMYSYIVTRLLRMHCQTVELTLKMHGYILLLSLPTNVYIVMLSLSCNV